MKLLTTTLICSAMAIASAGVSAQDAVKKDGIAKDSGSTMVMTAQQCKEHMAMAQNSVKKDSSVMKKDAMCNELLNKDSTVRKDNKTGEVVKP
ncbi:hypothetical protein RCH10_004680 [Variovorax sp. GrIS 2.14]|uniref:hypothetical protein n=1 Tax=Variovorax sp. GrIS 2.14 TaxID=3071709 RepID=UPI0038F67762